MHIAHRLFAATLIAMSGASVMVAISGLWDVGLVMSAGGSAFIAGLVGASLFGRADGQGALMAGAGAIFTTALGAAIAGLGIGLMIGDPAVSLLAVQFVGQAILSSAHVLGVWIATMTGAHLAIYLLRRKPAMAA
jgi:hypothetical protein